MFDKLKDNKPESVRSNPQQDNSVAPSSAPASSGRSAVIGVGIHIVGDVNGDENLVVEGKVDGKINLGAHQLDIGQGGQVNADVTAKVIKIAGKVRGDLTSSGKVIISRTGNVHGNIVAPRMMLEDGAIFKGSIDMDPGEPAKTKLASPARKTTEKTAEAPKVVANEKAKDNSGYSLKNG